MPSGTSERSSRQTKYQPLIDFLAAQTNDVTLSFTEIETIIGAPLPLTATNDSGLWHSPKHLQVRRWQEMGWHARFDRRNTCVHFTREE